MTNKGQKKTSISSIRQWSRAVGLAFILVLMVKGLLFQSYLIETTRMEKTLLMGDYIMISKVAYGARLPITLLSVPFFPETYSTLIQFPPIRIPGFSSIKANDLLVFNYPGQLDPPIDKKEVMTKRCVALPGDTLQLYDKNVIINNEKFSEPGKLQNNYRLVTDGTLLDDDFLKKYQISEGGMVSDMGIYDFPLTDSLASILKLEPAIRYIRMLKDFPGENVQYIFPIGHYHHNNKDYFGPVVVPFKGQKISIDFRSVELYREIIEYFEGNLLEVRNAKVYINGIERNEYHIKQNYYFVLDDNRDNAKDSRYWGFLPQSYIIGKASFVLFSYDTQRSRIRWNRIFMNL